MRVDGGMTGAETSSMTTTGGAIYCGCNGSMTA